MRIAGMSAGDENGVKTDNAIYPIHLEISDLVEFYLRYFKWVKM